MFSFLTMRPGTFGYSVAICFLVFIIVLPENAVAHQTPNEINRLKAIYPYVIFPRVFDKITTDGLETPIQIRAYFYINLAAWNAWSNYHPTAVDIFGRSRFKRPASEHTTRNKNVAVMFAQYRLYLASPQSFGGTSEIAEFRTIIREQGHDPDDDSKDMTTPVGIGNRIGYDTAKLMAIDGWNSEGDLTSSAKFYRLPFQDYTGYQPLNSPWEIKYPFRWQPVLETDDKGFFFRQEHVVPQLGRQTMLFSMSKDELMKRRAPSPYSDTSVRIGHEKPGDLSKFKHNAEKVFERSAKLTEYQRVMAEMMDNKVKTFRSSYGGTGIVAISPAFRFIMLPEALDWNLDDDMVYGLSSNIVSIESMSVVWKEKLRNDLIRPTGQTMKMLFGNRKFKVWAGPGKSKPVTITAGDWQPYIRTMPHSEYPSATACLCYALVEQALLVSGNNNSIPYKVTIPKGTSRFYPGKIPSKDFVLDIKTLTEWRKLCGISRLWAGVHFEPSIKAGRDLCRGIGRRVESVTAGFLSGKPRLYWMEWLPKGTEKFWEK